MTVCADGGLPRAFPTAYQSKLSSCDCQDLKSSVQDLSKNKSVWLLALLSLIGKTLFLPIRLNFWLSNFCLCELSSLELRYSMSGVGTLDDLVGLLGFVLRPPIEGSPCQKLRKMIDFLSGLWQSREEGDTTLLRGL